MKNPNCPQCGKPLNKVKYTGGPLNRDQWSSQIAGDWFCETCPDNGRAKNRKCYWWDHEIRAALAEKE